MSIPSWYGSTSLLTEVDSTNSFIQRELSNGSSWPCLPWLVRAEKQTAGRGRNSKSWLSDRHSLTFSIAWLPPAVDAMRLAQLPLHVGIAISEAIRPFVEVFPKVKWPNDVMLAGRKASGILIESIQSSGKLKGSPSSETVLVIGVGINCDVDLEALDSTVAARATSIRKHLRAEYVSLQQEALQELIYEAVIARFAKVLSGFVDSPIDLEAEWPRFCFLSGRYIAIQTSNGRIEGECQGIDERGAIIVRDVNGHWRTTLSGEIVEY